ncbi:hypothetical protein [Allorhizobium taibaishanense]|uniref:Holin n=1 Tax=Allorhizobium taibaishanense TaxID=887144 RepID=A0A1Q9A0Q3_9HYPH|nr:hypothetical protein [Allorhizobium taibaishanense]MBB4007819.1 hypothetical protein [Allorhizobium taibaishanense]OLP48161.1 hypothetical protein BJF91_08400 [Allorhizobium taibaishanense]
MNTNLLHNIINTLIAAIPALALFDWTPFFSEAVSLKIVGLLGLAKILINTWRDGPVGMVRPQPPIDRGLCRGQAAEGDCQ